MTLVAVSDDSANTVEELESRRRELKGISSNVEERTKQENGVSFAHCRNDSHPILIIIHLALDKSIEHLTSKLQELKAELEKLQVQQSEDSRGMNRQQKNTERYLAKKQMLTTRKEECNRSIRDLGVLPEEAFEKYTKDKVEKVSHHRRSQPPQGSSLSAARQETSIYQ